MNVNLMRPTVYSGQALVRWSNAEKKLPVHLGAYNHRAEAFYRLDSPDGQPNHKNVIMAKERGLKKVQTLKWNTPDPIFSKVVHILNQYHEGSGTSFLDYFSEASSLQAEWKAEAFNTGVTTSNPKYASLYEQFVLSQAASANHHGYFRNWESYKNTLSYTQLPCAGTASLQSE